MTRDSGTTRDYVTVKSNFHGSGVYSRHKTGELATQAVEKWHGEPGLIVAVYKSDGKLYRQDYMKNPYGWFELMFEEAEPLQTIQERGSCASARDYLVSESDLRSSEAKGVIK